jgi:hypothetical protein
MLTLCSVGCDKYDDSQCMHASMRACMRRRMMKHDATIMMIVHHSVCRGCQFSEKKESDGYRTGNFKI